MEILVLISLVLYLASAATIYLVMTLLGVNGKATPLLVSFILPLAVPTPLILIITIPTLMVLGVSKLFKKPKTGA